MHIVLYKPDIPQNTAAIIRLGACLNLKIHLIEPCGFNLNDKRFERVVMDYLGLCDVIRHTDFQAFLKKYKNSISNLKLNINLYYKFSNKIPRMYNWYYLKNNKEFVPSFTKKIFSHLSTLF